jgi:glycosyltransferase involved in cell wall biosynthesis
MRIAIIGARGIPARWGGFETVASELAPRLVARGHDVTVYCRPRYSLPSRPSTYRGVSLRYLPALYTKSLETLSHEALIAAHTVLAKFDVLYVLGFRASFLYLPARLVGKPVVMNTDGFDWLRRKWGRLGRAYLHFVEAVGARWAASHLICDSRSLQAHFREAYGRDTTFISYGANLFESTGPSIVQGYGLTPGEYLLVVARIEPENNADLIVRAFAGVSTGKELAVVGGANYRSPYFDSLRQTADKRVRFLGGIYEPGHIEEIYANSYAYIHGHEVGGTNPALLHAMGCGCCVAALDVPFNREVVADSGLLWDKSEEELRRRLEELLECPGRADALRTAARERVRTQYSWETVADEYDQFFRAIGARCAATTAPSGGGASLQDYIE